jgi:hypothetical protein
VGPSATIWTTDDKSRRLGTAFRFADEENAPFKKPALADEGSAGRGSKTLSEPFRLWAVQAIVGFIFHSSLIIRMEIFEAMQIA